MKVLLIYIGIGLVVTYIVISSYNGEAKPETSGIRIINNYNINNSVVNQYAEGHSTEDPKTVTYTKWIRRTRKEDGTYYYIKTDFIVTGNRLVAFVKELKLDGLIQGKWCVGTFTCKGEKMNFIFELSENRPCHGSLKLSDGETISFDFVNSPS